MDKYKELRTELLRQLNDCTRQALAQRVKTIRRRYGPMAFRDGVAVIAHEQGINLAKYLEVETVDRIREIMGRKTGDASVPREVKKTRRGATYIKIGTDLPHVDLLLSTTLCEDAKRMAEIYPRQYILENSLRIVIRRVLDKKYPGGWWDTRVKQTIKDNVNDRKAEESRQPWHGKRGQHEIFYTDFKDLKNIIFKNWDAFQAIFPSQQWIFQKLDELEHPRNVIAHNNPLSKNDMDRIRLYFSDWEKLLEQKKALL